MNCSTASQRPPKRTKIVATIGPASQGREVLRAMILAGLDVARLNFSHGDYQSHADVIKNVRELSEETGVPIAIMADLRGPRIRIGEVENDKIELEPGQTVILTPEPVLGNTGRVSISFPELADDLNTGDRLLIDDGDVQLRAERFHGGGDIHCSVIQGGSLSSRRGINLPGIRVNLPAVTDKDKRDVEFGIEQQVDFLALSFVQCAADVRNLKQILADHQADIPVIAKIEKKSGLDDIDAIIQEAYGVMVARGDLALEMSFPEVPIAQKQIIAACRAAATPVITATQMLESMIYLDHPTRAEATDVANAVFDGTDALMLSGESAIGEHPVKSVATMATIAARAEKAWLNGEIARPPWLPPPEGIDANIAYMGHVVARNLKSAAIATYTQSGITARRICRYRPPAPILALSPHLSTQRRLTLSWGVTSILSEEYNQTSQMSANAVQQAKNRGLVKPGDNIIISAGIPLGQVGNTNLLKVEEITE